MKNLSYVFFRGMVHFVLFFTFRSRHAFNKERLSKTDPIIFVSNHQNGFIDAIQIPTTISRHVHFMTRSDVFKNPLIGKFLRANNLIPIYRLRDGRETLAKNKKVLEYCADLLVKGEVLQMFPEGNHHPARYLRSFKNGFAEIAFMAMERNPKLSLKVVPVGLNYNTRSGFPSTVTIIYGKPIPVVDYFNPEGLKDSIANLKEEVFSQMRQLTTNIPKEEYDELLALLKNEGVDFLNPKIANELIESRAFSGKKKRKEQRNIWEQFIYYLFIANSFPALLFWWKKKKGIKDDAFVNTFRFVFIWVIFPLYYLVIAGAIAYFFGSGFGLWYLGFSILLGYLRKRLRFLG